MCGIAGIVPNRGLKAEKGEAVVERMLRGMAHRGPDGMYMYRTDQLIFGMARLAIVGGETGQQPIWNESHQVAVVCNGEIYNHMTLRAKLVEMGHTFNTESDVEVIVHLYEEYGREFLSHLKGIFALALWDQTNECLMLARDRLGVKPLMYCKTYAGLAFASELKALLPFSQAESFQAETLDDYYSLRFVPAPRTLISDIHKLPPGHFITIKNQQISLEPYWELPAGRPDPDGLRVVSNRRSERIQTLREVTRAAVSLQCVPSANTTLRSQSLSSGAHPHDSVVKTPPVKSATLLSGGLDSSLLVALQKEATGFAPDTITVSFDAPLNSGRASVSEFDEQRQAREVAEHFGSKHLTNQITAEEAWSALPRILAALDEPVADPTSIPLWFASQLAHDEGYRVLYSGEGVDELFGGYSIYRQTYWLRTLGKWPRALRQQAALLLQKLHIPGHGALGRSLHPVDTWYRSVGNLFTEHERDTILRQDVRNDWARQKSRSLANHGSGPSRSVDTDKRAYSLSVPAGNTSGTDFLTQMLLFDCKYWLPDNTLSKSDKISMAHSVELRVPFLDEDLVEFAMLLPSSDKMRFGVQKYLMKAAFKDVLPASVVKRRKAGFPVPITAWVFGEWKERIYDLLMSEASLSKELYNEAQVQRLLQDESDRTIRRSARLIWALVTMEFWMQSCAAHRAEHSVFEPVQASEGATRRLTAR